MSDGLCGPGKRKTAFFVTLSGGGSRAAYFAARVLHEIDQVDRAPLTKNIDGIFSVSGGSITAALYGVSRDEPEVGNDDHVWPIWSENLTDDVLSKPLGRSMATELVKPYLLSSYLFGDLTRTDLLQVAIEKEIFLNQGSPITYRSLNKSRPPIFVISAMATSEGEDSFAPRPFGSLFVFSRPDLARIGDDIDSVSIAKAVSASAAFPGLLSAVTLPRYRRSVHEVQLGKPRFVHLIDGGNADNLGLLGVKRALLENDYRLLRDCETIAVLSVDAFGKQGVHSDTNSHESSPVGWLFDHKSALASFDALLAANRARLLGEFKSRLFMPPGSEELCEKDGLPDDVCGGGVRLDWEDVNRLLKKKLYFVHLNFDSPEVVSQTSFTYCNGNWPDRSGCEVKPLDGFKLQCLERQLRRRIKAIPTTFGLSQDEKSDLRAFVSLINQPKNVCFRHLSDVVNNGEVHSQQFYELASASCDETPVLKRGEVPVTKVGGHARGRTFGDVILRDMKKRFETSDEKCIDSLVISHEEQIELLYDAKIKLIKYHQYLSD
ncbi:patatin-like phospholipase family protein [Ralstonia soli]|uniref:Patatin-like phospholipase family protein n=1 Tax=Ralstonia soli TaxID=2953896 RepID=A0ABT1ANT1_9RALS|nr:patatin-like phospholipase family protein [Ralstonia soli]MCO5399752.1 patatin-like phospholipase family protein [Ralstonia soli]